VCLGDALDDGETEARATRAGARRLAAREGLLEARRLGWHDAGPAVEHGDDDAVLCARQFQFHRTGMAGMAQGVLDQVDDRAAQRLGMDRNCKVGAGPSQADAPPVGGSEPGLRARGANNLGSGETVNTVAAISASARLLLFPLADVKTMAKGRGTILQAIEAKDELAAVAIGDGSAFTVSGIGRGGKPQELRLTAKDLAPHRAARARKGHPLESKIKPAGIVAS